MLALVVLPGGGPAVRGSPRRRGGGAAGGRVVALALLLVGRSALMAGLERLLLLVAVSGAWHRDWLPCPR